MLNTGNVHIIQYINLKTRLIINFTHIRNNMGCNTSIKQINRSPSELKFHNMYMSIWNTIQLCNFRHLGQHVMKENENISLSKRIKFTLLRLVELKLMQANNITREVMGTKGNEGTPTT